MVLLSPSPPPPLLLSCLTVLFLLSAFCSADQFLKLRLLHNGPRHRSPSHILSSDSHRLSVLFSSFRTHQTLKSPVVSGASSGSGQYFVSLSIGTPPQNLLLVADTGSDLVWVKCSACTNCSNHSPGSAFLARQSSTFRPHHCYDPYCQLVPQPGNGTCNRTRLHSPCRYEYSYGDGSSTAGFFARETTTLNTSSGRRTRHRGFSFGCGFSVSGPSVSGPSFNGAQGVMGLGRGPISLSTQLGRRFGNKFSYCLKDYTLSPPPTSYLTIGSAEDESDLQNTRVSFTPLHQNPVAPTFYYIGIESVSVNGEKLRIDPAVWSVDETGNGGTVIDSGTTLTFLAFPAYRRVLAAVRRRVRLPSAAVELTPAGFDLCVNVSGVERPKFPRLKLKLEGGSILSPPPRNYFIDTAPDVKCLAVQPVVAAGPGFSVIGNLMQQGYLLEFDRDRSRLGFSRHGCARP